MKLFHLLGCTLIAASLALISTASPTVLAQDTTIVGVGSNVALEEIVVTGRKREENLIDVPVAISVWTAESLQEQGIITQQDLFDATVSLTFDSGSERTGVQPGIRGVQSDLPAGNRQKVSSFIDGQPMQGSQGNLQFQGRCCPSR